MAVFWPSRHMFSLGVWVDGKLRLTDREPFRFRLLPDTISHKVTEGESLWTLAGKYYRGFERPSGLWWVIADFQPNGGIFDPTIQLSVGAIIFVPSIRTVAELVLGEQRQGEIGL